MPRRSPSYIHKSLPAWLRPDLGPPRRNPRADSLTSWSLLSSCERKTSVSTLSLSPSLFSRTSTREMVLAPISERSRSAPSYRRPSAPLLSPGTSDLHFSFEIRVFCKESRELSWEFHWSFTSLCLACLLRHDSGSYLSSTVTLHLFCKPRYKLTSPHPSLCVFSIYSDLFHLTFQGTLTYDDPSTTLMIMYLDLSTLL